MDLLIALMAIAGAWCVYNWAHARRSAKRDVLLFEHLQRHQDRVAAAGARLNESIITLAEGRGTVAECFRHVDELMKLADVAITLQPSKHASESDWAPTPARRWGEE
ncbi:MAG TPA: hypothetical protein VD930_02400 [Gemmatimonadales bacterium]|nr:hypothetical protein [Gemmatimonadales bacterium]